MNKLQRKYKILLPGVFLFLVLLVACGKKFLNKPPQGTLNPSIVANKDGVQGILIGAYSGLDGEGLNNSGWGSAASNWTYGEVAADNAYKGSTASDQGDVVGLFQWNATPTNGYVSNKWDAMYDAIQRCNDVIRTMRQAKDISGADTVEFKAEALFLRGFYYFELRKIFHYPSWVDESVTFSNNNFRVPNVDGSGNYVEIWPKIEADFQYAMANLPATQPNKGQANKYAAEAFLAKVYMFEQQYDKAAPLLDDLITNGVTAHGDKYALQTNYSTNFDPDPGAKNNPESVFAAQMSVNDGSAAAGSGNGNYGDVLNFPYGGGPGACCGFFNPSQDLANAYKTDANGLPLLGTAFQAGANVSDGTAGQYTGNLDPRIDISIGRAGIPYLDWGPHPGDSWIRSTGDDGHFSPKKNVYAKSQQGTLSDVENNWANVELDANNVNLIRFADVLLWRAECYVLGSAVDLAKAEALVNQVRTRAANPNWWVYKDGAFDAATYTYKGGTIPADNYKISVYPLGYFANAAIAMAAIEMERRLELAMEGHRFFDLQRWQVAFPGSMTAILNTYAQIQAPIHPAQYKNVTFTTGKSEYFPIPQDQIDANNASGKVVLKQIPGY
ncbi:MAG TPA: RagB/SusD family nutrient uptake outer membrane protein [Puia sp.]|uniref:RagB/SusD family nutrient uptake outer membrane protein n=1 Tax=Puia sp. TaxID=2045100 RepID=UPI002C3F4E17|nr:RagB/SusD family nutrient uptake outer membrane protein [Puia sp.]HVU95754.1 RagB/SusD family nutrient uptake outer membrane protein [Puia sp.]